MKKYSRVISMAIALMLVFSCTSLSAFAANDMENNLPSNFVDIMSPDNGSARGPQVPTKLWNWDSGSYTGTVAYLGLGNGVYTNYLFQPSASGSLSYSVDFAGDVQMGRTYKYEIELYGSDKKLVDTSGTISFDDSGADDSGSFTDLDKNKTYYIKIVNRCEGNGQFFTGSIVISK